MEFRFFEPPPHDLRSPCWAPQKFGGEKPLDCHIGWPWSQSFRKTAVQEQRGRMTRALRDFVAAQGGLGFACAQLQDFFWVSLFTCRGQKPGNCRFDDPALSAKMTAQLVDARLASSRFASNSSNSGNQKGSLELAG